MRCLVAPLSSTTLAWGTAHRFKLTFKEVAIKKAIAAILAISASAFALPAVSAAPADCKDAEALVGKVIKAIAADRAGTFKEITGRNKKWVSNEFYPMVYDLSGKCMAHGQNEKLVGKTLIDLSDADGKEFVKECLAQAKSKGEFWLHYKIADPLGNKVLPMTAYCKKAGDMLVCTAIYQR